jgi:hypothetical protein
MRNIIILAIAAFSLHISAAGLKQVRGTVSLAKGVKITSGGTLFIFAKNAGTAAGNGAPPVAVLRIQEPKFPMNFTLTEQNTMIPGGAFDGPFSVYARYSNSGDALDKSGPQGTDKAHPSVKVGQTDVNIELTAK